MKLKLHMISEVNNNSKRQNTTTNWRKASFPQLVLTAHKRFYYIQCLWLVVETPLPTPNQNQKQNKPFSHKILKFQKRKPHSQFYSKHTPNAQSPHLCPPKDEEKTVSSHLHFNFRYNALSLGATYKKCLQVQKMNFYISYRWIPINQKGTIILDLIIMNDAAWTNLISTAVPANSLFS